MYAIARRASLAIACFAVLTGNLVVTPIAAAGSLAANVPSGILANAAENSRGGGGEPIWTAKENFSGRQPIDAVFFGVPPGNPRAFVPLILVGKEYLRIPPPRIRLTPNIPRLTPCVNCGPAGSVDKIVARIQAQLEKCRIKDNRRDRDPSKPDRFDCVADALDKAADELAKQPEFKKAEKIIRRAATKVRKAKTVKQATAALSTAKKQLLRSSGLVLAEHQKLASLTDNAKSVLRS